MPRRLETGDWVAPCVHRLREQLHLRPLGENEQAVAGSSPDLNTRHTLAHDDRRMGYELPYHDTYHGASGAPADDGTILENYGDAGVTRRPHWPGTDEDAAALVGDRCGIMDSVADGGGSINCRAQPHPGSADVTNRLMRFCSANYAVRVERGKDRNERCTRRRGDGDDLRRVLDPLRSLFGCFEDLLH